MGPNPQENTPQPTPTEEQSAPQPLQPEGLTPQPPQQGAFPVQPAVPQPPQAPAPMQSVSGAAPLGQPPAGGGSNKKLFILIAAIVGGLLVIGVIAAVLISVFSVSRKDYTDALLQYTEVASASREANIKMIAIQYSLSTSKTDTTFENDSSAAKDAFASMKTESEALGKLKAMKVGEGKTKYKAFDEKIKAYTTYADNLITSIKDARGASTQCDDGTGSVNDIASFQAAIDKCLAALDDISDTPNEDVKTLIDTLKAEYKKLASIAAQIATFTNPYGSDQYPQYKALRDQYYEVSDNITDADKDYRSNVEKHAKEVDPKDASSNLSKFLVSKAYDS